MSTPEVISLGDRTLRGVKTHRARSIEPRDTTRYRGIPITTVPRTLADLAGTLGLDDLATACHHAQVLHHTRPAHVDAVLQRRPNTRGAHNLRLIFVGDAAILLSRLEREFNSLVRGQSLLFRVRIARLAAISSTAAGPSTGSPSSSTATGSTTAATPGSATTAGPVRPTPAATSFGATPTATSSSGRRRCSPNSARC